MFEGLFRKKEPKKEKQATITFRVAKINDIKQLHRIRIAVHENRLSDPNLISYQDYQDFITERGKGWVCEINEDIVGFSVVDRKENNVWALFVLPKFEGKGIGKKLHDLMLDWYFSQTDKTLWLSTSPGTRAEKFYRKAGWIENGVYGKGEIKFEFKPDTQASGTNTIV
jgi:GNAT superfamily N-acetyltransferase